MKEWNFDKEKTQLSFETMHVVNKTGKQTISLQTLANKTKTQFTNKPPEI